MNDLHQYPTMTDLSQMTLYIHGPAFNFMTFCFLEEKFAHILRHRQGPQWNRYGKRTNGKVRSTSKNQHHRDLPHHGNHIGNEVDMNTNMDMDSDIGNSHSNSNSNNSSITNDDDSASQQYSRGENSLG